VLYEDLPELSRESALEVIATGSEEERVRAVLSVALFDPDWEFAQGVCLSLVDDGSHAVRMAAILGFSHIARIHGRLDVDRVKPVLKRLAVDPTLAGRVEDVEGDRRTFIV
jgi:hypothetical protein